MGCGPAVSKGSNAFRRGGVWSRGRDDSHQTHSCGSAAPPTSQHTRSRIGQRPARDDRRHALRLMGCGRNDEHAARGTTYLAPAAAKVTIAVPRLRQGNFSNVTDVGAGVHECRIDFGPGYRIYIGTDGDCLVILLGGGTKKRQQHGMNAAPTRISMGPIVARTRIVWVPRPCPVIAHRRPHLRYDNVGAASWPPAFRARRARRSRICLGDKVVGGH